MAAGNPQRVLLEFLNAGGEPQHTFSNEEIVMSQGVKITAPFNGEKELTLGLCPSVQIQFALLNDVRQLSNFRFGECKAWIGARIDSGTPASGSKTQTFTGDGLYEFAPLGVFRVERPDIVQKDIIEITANDRMTLFDKEMPSKETLGLNPTASHSVTILQLLQAMCTKAGVTLKSTSFLNNTLSFTSWPQSYFEGKTMREVLKWIAEAACSIARFDRTGRLELAWFGAQPVKTFAEGAYKDFTPCWYTVQAIDGLSVRNQEETSESVYPPQSSPTNSYIIAGNPFLR